MKKSTSRILAATVAVVAISLASESFAGTYFPGPGYDNDNRRGGGRRGGGYSSVPELDASGAPIALALVGGIAGVAIERRRKNKKK